MTRPRYHRPPPVLHALCLSMFLLGGWMESPRQWLAGWRICLDGLAQTWREAQREQQEWEDRLFEQYAALVLAEMREASRT